jgi:hypothetical protein
MRRSVSIFALVVASSPVACNRSHPPPAPAPPSASTPDAEVATDPVVTAAPTDAAPSAAPTAEAIPAAPSASGAKTGAAPATGRKTGPPPAATVGDPCKALASCCGLVDEGRSCFVLSQTSDKKSCASLLASFRQAKMCP